MYLCFVVLKMEDKLVRLVRERPWLYDTSRKDYRNFKKKNSCWEQIAGELRLPVNEVLKRWKSLRTCYAREKRKKVPAGNNPQGWKKKKWAYLDMLGFLDQHVKARRVFSCTEEEESSEEVVDAFDVEDVKFDVTSGNVFENGIITTEVASQHAEQSDVRVFVERTYLCDTDAATSSQCDTEANRTQNTSIQDVTESPPEYIPGIEIHCNGTTTALQQQRSVETQQTVKESTKNMVEKEDDSDLLFCQSLATYFKELPSRKHKLALRKMMLDTIDEYLNTLE